MALFPILYFAYRFGTKGKVVPVAELDFYSGSRDIEEEEELPPKNFAEKAWRAVRLPPYSVRCFLFTTFFADYVNRFAPILSLSRGFSLALHYMVCRNKFSLLRYIITSTKRIARKCPKKTPRLRTFACDVASVAIVTVLSRGLTNEKSARKATSTFPFVLAIFSSPQRTLPDCPACLPLVSSRSSESRIAATRETSNSQPIHL